MDVIISFSSGKETDDPRDHLNIYKVSYNLSIQSILSYINQLFHLHGRYFLRLIKTVPFLIYLLLSTFWIISTSIFVISSWENTQTDITSVYKKRATHCKVHYVKIEARERCLTIMSLEKFQQRSISVFNNLLLIFGLPLIGLLAVSYLIRKFWRRKL